MSYTPQHARKNKIINKGSNDYVSFLPVKWLVLN